MPAGAGPDFINAVFEVETNLTAQALLSHLHEIEARFGRQRRVRWAARTMDLDLLAYGDVIAPDPETWQTWAATDQPHTVTEAPDMMILPHPRLQERGFVLVPWAEIAPTWRHPVLDQTVQQLLHQLPASERDGPIQQTSRESLAFPACQG